MPVLAAIPGGIFAGFWRRNSASGRGRQFSRAEDGWRARPGFTIGW
jgi:hypothetical protein